jgi:hypothetical protein
MVWQSRLGAEWFSRGESRRGRQSRRGGEWSGGAGHRMEGQPGPGLDRPGRSLHGVVELGLDRPAGQSRTGLDWSVQSRRRKARRGSQGADGIGAARLGGAVRYGARQSWRGMVLFGTVALGIAMRGIARRGSQATARQGRVWPGDACLSVRGRVRLGAAVTARNGQSRLGAARHGRARPGTAPRGGVRQPRKGVPWRDGMLRYCGAVLARKEGHGAASHRWARSGWATQSRKAWAGIGIARLGNAGPRLGGTAARDGPAWAMLGGDRRGGVRLGSLGGAASGPSGIGEVTLCPEWLGSLGRSSHGPAA